MKVIVLATDSASTWIVVNALRVNYPHLVVGLESPISRYRLLRNRVTRLGFNKVIGQLFFILYLPILKMTSRSLIKKILRLANLSTVRPLDLIVSEFESANSAVCHEWLQRQAPDVVIVNGTRILSHKTLTACSAVFLNTHCGITPAYRGIHGGYWAFANGDSAHAGVTIHIVDDGIDTGGIVYQKEIEIGPNDNFLTYPVRQYIAAIPLLQNALRDVSEKKLRTYSRSDLPSSIWYHPTIWQYFVTRLLRGVR